MIQIAVCDDQPIHMRRLSQMIRDICAYKIPDSFDCQTYDGFYSAEDIIKFLKDHMINILFLDIELEGMNGFELAAILNQEFPDILIIFVSAYENYVYSAFKYTPFRFLRKSHLSDELEPALLDAIDSLMSKNKTIELNTTDGKFETRLSDIVYFESEKNYLVAHLLGNKSYRLRNTVAGIFEQLKDDDFYRIHQSIVINLASIKRISGYSDVIMSNGVPLPISLRNVSGFKNAYMEYTNRRFSE